MKKNMQSVCRSFLTSTSVVTWELQQSHRCKPGFFRKNVITTLYGKHFLKTDPFKNI